MIYEQEDNLSHSLVMKKNHIHLAVSRRADAELKQCFFCKMHVGLFSTARAPKVTVYI